MAFVRHRRNWDRNDTHKDFDHLLDAFHNVMPFQSQSLQPSPSSSSL